MRYLTLLILVHTPLSAYGQLGDLLEGKTLGGKVIKGAAIGYAVKESAGALDKFINTLTLRNKVQTGMATKVVPVMTVGDRGYVGGAQVVGPKPEVTKVQVVWMYEDQFNRNTYRIRALIPSSSLNPLSIKRVPKVGLSALIDVALDSAPSFGRSHSGGISASRVFKAAAVAVGVNAAAKPLNSFINTITFSKSGGTRVVPQMSFGERAYIGGAQITGSAKSLGKVKGVVEYQEMFDRSRFRVRALAPVSGTNPLTLKRVDGVGVTALIDTSVAKQEADRRAQMERNGNRSGTMAIGTPAEIRRKEVPPGWRDKNAHDNGLHLGWEIGKHKGWDKQKQKGKKPVAVIVKDDEGKKKDKKSKKDKGDD